LTRKRGQIYLIRIEFLKGVIMPRIGRIVFVNYPHHIVQRGHDRKAVWGQSKFTLTPRNTIPGPYGKIGTASCMMWTTSQ
jgi:hypothetical protein